MSTRLELRTFVRAIARVESHDVSDATLDTYLDEGYREVLAFRAWPWAYQVTPVTTAMTANQNYIVMNAAIQRINSIVNVQQKYPLREVSISDWANVQNQVVGSSHPTHWARGNDDRIYLWPTPGTTDDLDVYHYDDPGFAAPDGSLPPWNAMFHEILADWAMVRLWEQEEDFQKSDNYRARFETKLRRMVKFYDTDMQQRPMIMGGGHGVTSVLTNQPFLNDGALGAI